MSDTPTASIKVHFSQLPDPRTDENRIRHQLLDMVVIAICAVICGADSWVAVESFGHAKSKWLSRLLKLPNGIPSHDTLSRVFGLIDSVAFEHCFINWIKQVIEVTDGQVVAVDGKHLRRSYDTATDQGALRLVSAWASSQSVTLGQLKVSDYSNEIPAIPQLLELLTLSGCIVTTDAMGCHPQIAQQIVNADADYVLALKANQGQLHEDVKLLFDGILDNWKLIATLIASIVVPVIGVMIALHRQTDKRIDDLRDEMNQRFDTVNAHIDALRGDIKEIREDLRMLISKLIPNRED